MKITVVNHLMKLALENQVLENPRTAMSVGITSRRYAPDLQAQTGTCLPDISANPLAKSRFLMR